MPLFEPDTSNPHLRKAAELRDIFARDATERDQAGGRPPEQIRLLKQSGLLNILIPKHYGGDGAPHSTALRITREFAKVDGSLGHIYGYHFGPLQNAYLRGTAEQAADIYRRSAAGNWFWGNTVNSFSRACSAAAMAKTGCSTAFAPSAPARMSRTTSPSPGEEQVTNERFFAAIPADREGITIENDWDGVGQRQTGSGTVTYCGVRVAGGEVLEHKSNVPEPFRSLGPAGGSRASFSTSSSGAHRAPCWRHATIPSNIPAPWIYSGVEKHTDDPWIKRQYGELAVKTQAATALADKAADAFDRAWRAWTGSYRRRARTRRITIASANVLAGNTALEVTSEIFEVMGAPLGRTAERLRPLLAKRPNATRCTIRPNIRPATWETGF